MLRASVPNQRKCLRAAYVVTSAASLLRMRPPTLRAAPKVGARKPGLQGEPRGWLREETKWDPGETGGVARASDPQP